MVCELLDIKCIFVNELIGSVILSGIIAVIFYFIIAGKLRLGFDTTIAFAFPLLLIVGLSISGFPIIFAFSAVIIGWMLASILNKIIGNR